MKTLIASTIEGFRLGAAVPHRNLCVFPLFNGEDGPPRYLSLKQGLERKLVEITEVSEGGSVPNLKVTNQADLPVLLLDGEELAGAKQNRIANTSLLLAAHSETVIPVSCTEQGRWRYTSPVFAESGEMMSSKARYGKSERVAARLRANAGYDAVQSEVWSDVRELHTFSGTSSSTGAMRDVYAQKSGDLEEYLRALPLQAGQKGLVVFLGGKLAGLDWVSRSDAYRDLHDKLVKSHAVEALHRETGLFDPVNLQIEAHLFLKAVAGAPVADEFKPAGLGTDIRFDSDAAGGAALAHEGAVIHLTAFRKPGAGEAGGGAPAAPRWSLTDRLVRRASAPAA